MKKFIIAASLCAALLLSACGAETHTWEEATCTSPRRCSSCGETEGLPLGHDASGSANYQQAVVCSRCGEVMEAKVPGSFEEAGIAINMKAGTEYDYTTKCASTAYHKTTGKAEIVSDTVISGDDTHEALDGCEWHIVAAKAVFSDTNAQEYGVHVALRLEDYYTSDIFDSSAVYNTETGYTTHVINMNGSDAECIESVNMAHGDWQTAENGELYIEYTITLEYRVPKGYDGIVLGFLTAVKNTDESLPIDELYNGKNLLAYAPVV